MAKQKAWIKWATLGLAHVFGILEVSVTEKGVQVRRLFSKNTINNSRINNVNNSIMGLEIDVASGRGENKPYRFSKMFMTGLDELAEKIEY